MQIRIRVDGMDEVIRSFDATSRQVVAASRRAINKTARWAGQQVARDLAATNNLPLRAITRKGKSQRVRLRLAGSAKPDSASVWVGGKPIKAAYVGALSQNRKGARAGKHRFPGGFLATMKSGHRGVYARKTLARLPIVEQTVRLANSADLAERINRQIPEKLREWLRQELNYQVNVRGR